MDSEELETDNQIEGENKQELEVSKNEVNIKNKRQALKILSLQNKLNLQVIDNNRIIQLHIEMRLQADEMATMKIRHENNLSDISKVILICKVYH